MDLVLAQRNNLNIPRNEASAWKNSKILQLIICLLALCLLQAKTVAWSSEKATSIDVAYGSVPFVIDGYIHSTQNLEKHLNSPIRPSQPAVSGAKIKEDLSSFTNDFSDFPLSPKQWRPFLVKNRDKFLLYNLIDGQGNQKHLLMRESSDLINWSGPRPVLNLKGYVTHIVESENWPHPNGRTSNYTMVKYFIDSPGITLAHSDDGRIWRDLSAGPQYSAPALFDDKVNWFDGPLDIIDIGWDRQNAIYYAFVKMFSGTRLNMNSRTNSPGWGIRLVGRMTSEDLMSWTNPEVLFEPDANDSGITEFYSATPVQIPNGYLALLRVLRDDLAAGDDGVHGIGYTTLAHSLDNKTWVRERSPFFDRSKLRGSFDNAHAWLTSAVKNNDTWLLAYSAYDAGHKVGTRNIGLTKISTGKWAYYQANDGGRGYLKTKLLKYSGKKPAKITMICEPENGSIAAKILISRKNKRKKSNITCSQPGNPNEFAILPGDLFELEFALERKAKLFGLLVE